MWETHRTPELWCKYIARWKEKRKFLVIVFHLMCNVCVPSLLGECSTFHSWIDCEAWCWNLGSDSRSVSYISPMFVSQFLFVITLSLFNALEYPRLTVKGLHLGAIWRQKLSFLKFLSYVTLHGLSHSLWRSLCRLFRLPCSDCVV